jgi:hypothetical protein
MVHNFQIRTDFQEAKFNRAISFHLRRSHGPSAAQVGDNNQTTRVPKDPGFGVRSQKLPTINVEPYD